MTGPEHYREAEKHLKFALGDNDPEWHQRQAQVHATIALAAATALVEARTEWMTWREIAGTKDGDQP